MKTIYFDIGGVLFKDGMTKFIEKISLKFPVLNEDSFEIYKLIFHKSPNARKLRTGELKLKDFYSIELDKLKNEYSFELRDYVSEEEISRMWFDQYEPIIGMTELIVKLKAKGHKIGVISANFKERVDYIFKKNKVINLLDKKLLFFAYNLKLDKKNPVFYEKIVDIIGDSILDSYYIEDAQNYIDSAKNAGFKNALLYDYKAGESLESILNQLKPIEELLNKTE
jgi:FMN phosphatase YigB (HAD superfamily)